MLTRERVPTGIAGLDSLIQGGFPANRSFLVTGEPGTGKTIFALQFLLDGLARGENGVYVAADENLSDVVEQAASLGWDLERYTRSNALSILNAGSYVSSLPATGREKHIDVTRAVRDLTSHVTQAAAKRLVLDPAGPFVLLRDSAARIQDQTRLLIKLLRTSMNTTNLLTSYAVPRTGEKTRHGIEEYLVAGVITLRMVWQDKRAKRTLGIQKMRSTNVKPAQYEFDIVTGTGIMLLGER